MRSAGLAARLVVVIAATLGAAASPAVAAPAFVTVGQTAPTADSLGFGGCAVLCNAVQFSSVTSPSPGYDIPFDGVFTRWSVRAGVTINNAPEWARARTFRRTSATTATLISQGAQGPLTTPSALHTFWDRIPATAGDVLGAQLHSGAFIDETVPIYTDGTDAGDVAARTFEDPGPDIGGTTTGTGFAHLRVNVSGRFEHDTDHDGYGDGSQDLCPGDAAIATSACSGTLLGSDMQGPYQRLGSCAGGGGPCLRLQLTTAGGASTAAPVDGVVVRWRIQAPVAGDYQLRIVNPAAGGGYTFAVSSDPQTVGADEALQTFPARLPIAAGGYVALAPPLFGAQPRLITAPAGATYTSLGVFPDGSPATISGSLPGVILYDADVEPDADHDTYGDVTQDRCPTSAETQGACPPVVAAPQPGAGPPILPATPAGAPRITALSLRYSRFRVLPRGAVLAARPHAGSAVLVTLSSAARVQFRVRRLTGGVRRSGVCRPLTARTKGLPRCTRATLVHAFTRSLGAGRSTTAYSGRFRSRGQTHGLVPGRYRLEAAVLASSGRAGAAVARNFTLVR